MYADNIQLFLDFIPSDKDSVDRALSRLSSCICEMGNSTRCGMTFTHTNPLSFGCKTQRFVVTPHFTTLFDNSD